MPIELLSGARRAERARLRRVLSALPLLDQDFTRLAQLGLVSQYVERA
ncbi:MAG TPA: hypothetical protein VHM31_01925 [Polyangia bacterium]|nr:hypothetical protein [Polyangia bacterium]